MFAQPSVRVLASLSSALLAPYLFRSLYCRCSRSTSMCLKLLRVRVMVPYSTVELTSHSHSLQLMGLSSVSRPLLETSYSEDLPVLVSCLPPGPLVGECDS